MAIIVKPSGGGSSVALSDATPTDVTSAAASAGVGTLATRDDHRHGGGSVATSTDIAPIANNTDVTWTATSPGTPPPAIVRGVGIDPNGTTIATSHDGTPFFTVYPFTGTFGTPATAVPTGATQGRGASVHPDGDAVAVAYSSGDHISVFPWDGTSLGTEILPPVSPVGSYSGDCMFSPAGDFLASAEGDGGPLVYPWNGTALGTPISPTVTATGLTSVRFSPDGKYLLATPNASPYVEVYPFDGTTLGTAVVPSSLPPGEGHDAAFSPDGRFVAVAHQDVGGFCGRIYAFSNGTFGSVVADIPLTSSGGAGNGIDWSPDGRFVLLTQNHASGAVGLRVISFDGTTLGPETQIPAGSSGGTDVRIRADGRFAPVGFAGTPFVSAYKLTRELGV